MSLGLDCIFSFHTGEVFNYNLLKTFLIPFLFLFFFWDSYNSNVGAIDIIFGGFKITADGDCSHEIKNTLEGMNSRISEAEERISELED